MLSVGSGALTGRLYAPLAMVVAHCGVRQRIAKKGKHLRRKRMSWPVRRDGLTAQQFWARYSLSKPSFATLSGLISPFLAAPPASGQPGERGSLVVRLCARPSLRQAGRLTTT